MAVLITCKCGQLFKAKESRVKLGRGKFCSKKCMYLYRKSHGNHSEETKKKIGDGNRGKKRSEDFIQVISVNSKKMWSNESYRLKQFLSHLSNREIGYSGIHKRLARVLGKAVKCSKCGCEDKKIEWANISHTYLQDISDYMPLCVKCHRLHDKEYKGAIKRRFSWT